MHRRHREMINECCSIIASRVDMNILWPKLMDYGIFNENNRMVEHWVKSLNELATKKEIIQNIRTATTRHAYYKLAMGLRDCDYQDLADYLEEYITIKPDTARSSEVLDLSLKTNGNLNGEQQIEPGNREDLKTKGPTSFTVRVRKSKIFRDETSSLHELPRYRMRSKPRGLVLLMTQLYYEGLEKRHGAEVDHANLLELFTQMGFLVFQTPHNLTAQEIIDKVREFSRRGLLKDVDSCFVIISGHGDHHPVNGGVILGSEFYTLPKRKRKNAMVFISQILQFFTNENCPQLKGKPKMFFLQTCRGPLEQRSRDEQANNEIARDGTCGNPVYRKPIEEEPREYDDILVAHATLRGYQSYRNVVNGSWFFQTICEVFMEHAWLYPIHDLLNLVDARVKERYKAISQTPSYEYIGFSKHLYINPGLYEERSENPPF